MSVFLEDTDVTIWHGDVLDALRELPSESVQTCVTSPPYWGLRDYGTAGQIGLEPTPDEYVAALVAVFAEVRRVLRGDGTVWLNLGDSYAGNRSYQVPQTIGAKGHDFGRSNAGMTVSRRRDDALIPRADVAIEGLKAKDLVGIPWRVAFALQADGWYLRSDIIWAKPNPMPESVTDRPTKSHEYVFLLSKAARYYFDQEAVREASVYPGDLGVIRGVARSDDGMVAAHAPSIHKRQLAGVNSRSAGPAARNIRSVWKIATEPYPDAHFATFPQELARRCILAGCPEGGTVLDCFGGAGTTALVARKHGRRSILIDLNADYCQLAADRIAQQSLLAVP